MKSYALSLFLGLLVSCGPPSTVTPTASDLINQYNTILGCKGIQQQVGGPTQEQKNAITIGCTDLERIALGDRFTCLYGSICEKNGQRCNFVTLSNNCRTALDKVAVQNGPGGTVTPYNLDVN